MQVNFEQLPQAVSKLFDKLESIERLLLQKDGQPITNSDNIFSVQQAAEYLQLSVPTVYGLVSKFQIPYMKKGKRLYFSQQELKEWIKTGRKKTKADTDNETDNFLSSIKRGGRYE